MLRGVSTKLCLDYPAPLGNYFLEAVSSWGISSSFVLKHTTSYNYHLNYVGLCQAPLSG